MDFIHLPNAFTVAKKKIADTFAQLPSSNPGTGKPWLDAATGAVIVGAFAQIVPKTGGVFTGDVEIRETWVGAPAQNFPVLSVGRYVSGPPYTTVNAPMIRLEHITEGPFPFAGMLIYHHATGGGNRGGSYISLAGEEHSAGIQFDYLQGLSSGFDGDLSINITGATSSTLFKHQSNNIGRIRAGGFDVTGELTVSGGARFGPYTFATVPSASANPGATIRITDRSHRLATSDGTTWNWAGTTTAIS
jgi:hypothetical protein